MSRLTARYDDDNDVLYLALGKAVPASSDEDDDGLVIRYALSDGHPCGVTIIGFASAGWRTKLSRLSRLVGEHLHMQSGEVQDALRTVIH